MADRFKRVYFDPVSFVSYLVDLEGGEVRKFTNSIIPRVYDIERRVDTGDGFIIHFNNGRSSIQHRNYAKPLFGPQSVASLPSLYSEDSSESI